MYRQLTTEFKCRTFRNRFCATCLLCTFSFFQASNVEEAYTLQETQQSLQRKAQGLLNDNFVSQAISIDPPVFNISKDTLSFRPGAAFVKVDKYPNLARHPLRIPFQSQLRIEALRRFFASPDHNYIAFWEPYLKLADAVVARALVEIGANSGNEDSLREKLQRCADDIDEIFQGSVLTFVAQNHLKLKPDEQIRGKLVKVLFQPEPANAEIYIVGDFLYRVAGKSLDESLWLDVSHGNHVEILVGDWQYRARWESDKPWQVGLVPINEEGTYTIKRKPEKR